MKKLILLISWILPSLPAHSQSAFAEFDLESPRIDGIQAFSLGDSIFLSFADRKEKKMYWISPDGKKREIQMMIPHDAPIIGIQAGADLTVYYYYLNDILGQMVLQAMEQPANARDIKFSRPIFPVAGELLGVHVDKKEVTVVSYQKKSNQVRILTLKHLQVQHEAFFDMPLDLSEHIRFNAGFLVGNEMTSLRQGDKRLKLYRDDDHVVISLDEDEPGLENKKTTVVEMDIARNEKKVYELMRKDYDRFISYYFGDKVYQLSHSLRKHFRCDIFDLTSGQLLFSETFERSKSMHDHKIIVHRGKSVEVGYTDFYEMLTMAETTPSILVRNSADSTHLELTLGSVNYYLEPVIIPLPLPFIAPGLLLTLFITPINSNIRYFTMKENGENNFKVEHLEGNPAPSMRQIIDQYEISMTSEKPKDAAGWDLLYKGYVEYAAGVVGIYHQKDRKITLVQYNNIGE